MKPETMKKFLTPGAVWVCPNGWQYVVVDDGVFFSGLESARRANQMQSLYELRPDGTHPATLGIALDLARKAWNDHAICVYSVDFGPGGIRWYVSQTVDGKLIVDGHSAEFDALIAAIEAAPTEEGQ